MAEFAGEPRPRLFAELDEVKQVVDAGSGACLINSMSPQDHHAVETGSTSVTCTPCATL